MLIQCTYNLVRIALNAYMEMTTIHGLFAFSSSLHCCSVDMIELAAMSTYMVCLTIDSLAKGQMQMLCFYVVSGICDNSD